MLGSMVSSHAPVRGHRSMSASVAGRISSFKSCPREGASGQQSFAAREFQVSSHAPVRGHPLSAKV